MSDQSKVVDSSSKYRFRHNDIVEQVAAIEALFTESQVRLNKQSQLAGLIRSASAVSESWASGNAGNTDAISLFRALHIERISNAVRFLKLEPNKAKYLKDLLNGTLDFLERKPSHAKSILFELEVFTRIKKFIPDTRLAEPDVLVNFSGSQIAIPCKKIYSEMGVPKVISNAVSQIEANNEFGIVALNIDDLLPENVILNANTFSEMSNILYATNIKFLDRHKRHFLKYLSSSRIIAVIASSSLICDIHFETPKFNNANQWAIWTVPDLKLQHQHQIEAFRKMIMVDPN